MIFIKKDFLIDPDIVFLNHGSFGACPIPVFEVYQSWQRELENQPVEFLGRRAGALLAESRQRLAEYLHTSRDNLVYVTNATHGLNIIARSLQLEHGAEILASDHEYGAMDRTWKFLTQKTGAVYINHPIPTPLSSHKEFIEQFWSGVTPRTRVIFLSHITSPTALVFPIKAICERARAAGILTVIDGAHAPGQIPLDLDDLGCDFYSGNLHKWLCAPKGSAFLYARPEVQSLLEPLIVSWGWESEQPGPSTFVDHHEWLGTRDISAFLSVPAAIDFLANHNWEEYRRAAHKLVLSTAQQIEDLTHIPGLTTDPDIWYAQMGTSLLPDSIDISALKIRMYDVDRIEIPLIRWNGKNLIRFSFQAYNTIEDQARLIQVLKKYLI